MQCFYINYSKFLKCFDVVVVLDPDLNLTDKNYDEVMAAAHAAYKQQLTVIGRRNQFMNRNRKPSESVSQYALALR